MKQTPQDQSNRARFEPSKFSGEGFLGPDTRSLDEIVADDAGVLESSAISRERLAAVLAGIYDEAVGAFGAETVVGTGLKAVHYEAKGRIPCPFGDGPHAKGEVSVIHEPSGATFSLTPLGIHLIEKHGFFQGRGSPYRLEPALVIALLGMSLDG